MSIQTPMSIRVSDAAMGGYNEREREIYLGFLVVNEVNLSSGGIVKDGDGRVGQSVDDHTLNPDCLLIREPLTASKRHAQSVLSVAERVDAEGALGILQTVAIVEVDRAGRLQARGESNV